MPPWSVTLGGQNEKKCRERWKQKKAMFSYYVWRYFLLQKTHKGAWGEAG